MKKMDRRKFIRSTSLAVPAILFSGQSLFSEITREPRHKMIDDDFIKKMADAALASSKKSGASYSDFRLTNFRSQNISTRESTVQNISDNENFGFAVRVIVNGAWGFAASSTFNETEVLRVSEIACQIAKANKTIQKNRVELVSTPSYVDSWSTPVKRNPFEVSIDDKLKLLLGINEKAKPMQERCSQNY